MPGPAPKANPQHRIPRVGPVKLPAEGRQGDPPPWPLEAEPTAAEQRLWGELWATPQAVMWERLAWTRTVARYCRILLAAEDLAKDAMAEARQLEDKLGLTPKALRMLLWEVSTDEMAERRQQPAQDVRQRIKAV